MWRTRHVAFKVSRNGFPIEQVWLKDAVNTGIQYETLTFPLWEAAIAAEAHTADAVFQGSHDIAAAQAKRSNGVAEGPHFKDFAHATAFSISPFARGPSLSFT